MNLQPAGHEVVLEVEHVDRDVDALKEIRFDQDGGSPLHPVNLGLRMLNRIDRGNRMNEPPGRSTVNLCLKARK